MLNESIEKIDLIGPKRKFLLNNLNIFKIKDLLLFFPKKFLTLSFELVLNQESVFKARVLKIENKTLVLLAFNKTIFATFFNNKIFAFLKTNQTYCFKGTILMANNVLKITQPELVNEQMNYPTYCSTFANNLLNKIILKTIKDLPQFQFKVNGINLNQALTNMHTNQNVQEAMVFFKTLEAMFLKNQFQKIKSEKLSIIEPNLPFVFSENQEKIAKKIFNTLSSELNLNHIIFGEVASGKTLLAVYSALLIKQTNLTTILIVPTLALAVQHFELFTKYGIKCILFTSETKSKKIQEEIEKNEPKIIISTQIIFYAKQIPNVGLIIVDEMQKFGVNAINELLKKAKRRNILWLSATPLPRSMDIIFQNFISYSTLESYKPKKIKTIIMNFETICLKFEKLQNKKIYWILPNINENEISVGVLERAKFLQQHFQNVFILHSKIKDSEKLETINNFKNLTGAILVATSIVEIGINVPDAEIIIIENANQFGISSLHQMRGRVGRNGQEAFCILEAKKPNEKLEFLKNHEKGEEIANKDLEMRGMGRLTGPQQSGFLGFYFLTNQDENLIQNAIFLSNLDEFFIFS